MQSFFIFTLFSLNKGGSVDDPGEVEVKIVLSKDWMFDRWDVEPGTSA